MNTFNIHINFSDQPIKRKTYRLPNQLTDIRDIINRSPGREFTAQERGEIADILLGLYTEPIAKKIDNLLENEYTLVGYPNEDSWETIRIAHELLRGKLINSKYLTKDYAVSYLNNLKYLNNIRAFIHFSLESLFGKQQFRTAPAAGAAVEKATPEESITEEDTHIDTIDDEVTEEKNPIVDYSQDPENILLEKEKENK